MGSCVSRKKKRPDTPSDAEDAASVGDSPFRSILDDLEPIEKAEDMAGVKVVLVETANVRNVRELCFFFGIMCFFRL